MCKSKVYDALLYVRRLSLQPRVVVLLSDDTGGDDTPLLSSSVVHLLAGMSFIRELTAVFEQPNRASPDVYAPLSSLTNLERLHVKGCLKKTGHPFPFEALSASLTDLTIDRPSVTGMTQLLKSGLSNVLTRFRTNFQAVSPFWSHSAFKAKLSSATWNFVYTCRMLVCFEGVGLPCRVTHLDTLATLLPRLTTILGVDLQIGSYDKLQSVPARLRHSLNDIIVVVKHIAVLNLLPYATTVRLELDHKEEEEEEEDEEKNDDGASDKEEQECKQRKILQTEDDVPRYITGITCMCGYERSLSTLPPLLPTVSTLWLTHENMTIRDKQRRFRLLPETFPNLATFSYKGSFTPVLHTDLVAALPKLKKLRALEIHPIFTDVKYLQPCYRSFDLARDTRPSYTLPCGKSICNHVTCLGHPFAYSPFIGHVRTLVKRLSSSLEVLRLVLDPNGTFHPPLLLEHPSSSPPLRDLHAYLMSRNTRLYLT